jgi:type IV pilus assembly protein PilA
MFVHSTPSIRYQRGFTLIEMMVVVVLVGVLASLAVYGVRKYILSAKTSEAVSMMTSIKSAEEAFKGETFIYLDVSTSFDPANLYPSTTPGRTKVQWGGGNAALAAKWQTLGVHPDGPVAFGYAVVATAPGVAAPSLPTVKQAAAFNLPSTPATWQYIAIAKADLDGDSSTSTYVLSHSYSSEVYVENEGQ